MFPSPVRWQIYSRVLLILLPALIWAAAIPKAPKKASGRVKILVIDAGHGGQDVGCHYGGKFEKDVTLQVTQQLAQLLADSFPDVKVMLTRKDDVFVELHERAELANRNNADLFISIHVNASPSTSAYGTETYAMGLHKTEGNLSVAKRENASVLLESNYQNNYSGFDPNSPEGHIIFSLYQNQFLHQSLNLAGKVEQQFKQSSRTSRGVKQAGFLVLWKTAMPSILVETGYLSNARERIYLSSLEGQKTIAADVFKAFKAYHQEK